MSTGPGPSSQKIKWLPLGHQHARPLAPKFLLPPSKELKLVPEYISPSGAKSRTLPVAGNRCLRHPEQTLRGRPLQVYGGLTKPEPTQHSPYCRKLRNLPAVFQILAQAFTLHIRGEIKLISLTLLLTPLRPAYVFLSHSTPIPRKLSSAQGKGKTSEEQSPSFTTRRVIRMI